jgi:hypothetical protein
MMMPTLCLTQEQEAVRTFGRLTALAHTVLAVPDQTKSGGESTMLVVWSFFFVLPCLVMLNSSTPFSISM